MDSFTIKVPGTEFELTSNQFYQIREIADADAPSGYKEKGISKHPIAGVEENIVVPFDERTNTWNTGFYPTSACFNNVSSKERDNTLKQLNDHLIPILAKMVVGDITDYSERSNSIFDNFIPLNGNGFGDSKPEYKIKGNNIFNTKDPLKFLALYWAMLNGDIAPPGQIGNPRYKGVPYVLEDKQRTSTVNEDREHDKIKAITRILPIVEGKNNSDRELLQSLFTYLGFTIDIRNTKEKTLITAASRWLSLNNSQNATDFNEAYFNFSSEGDRERLNTYITLLAHIKSGAIKVERSEIYIGGKSFGMDKKQAANKIFADKEVYKEFLSL